MSSRSWFGHQSRFDVPPPAACGNGHRAFFVSSLMGTSGVENSLTELTVPPWARCLQSIDWMVSIGWYYRSAMSSSPHPFTLRQLQYVVAVAEELSFRRAAGRCHVSQPSLSAQLAQIEGALGVMLFERSKQPVILTAAGKEIV